MIHNRISVSGSRFAMLDLEDVEAEEVVGGTPPRELKEDGNASGSLIQEGKIVSVTMKLIKILI